MEKLYASTTSSVVTSGSTGAGAGASMSVKLLIAPSRCRGAPTIALAGPRLRRLQSCGERLLLQSYLTEALTPAHASGSKVRASVSKAPLKLRTLHLPRLCQNLAIVTLAEEPKPCSAKRKPTCRQGAMQTLVTKQRLS